MSPVVGIDLGTSHAVACVLRDGRPAVTASGLVPSAVAYPTFGPALVGAAALEHSVRDPTVALRLHPRRPDDRDRLARVAGRLLTKLKQEAQEQHGAPVTDAVIAVPATMFHAGREAIRWAAEEAGFRVLRIITAPAAAALAYGHGRPDLDERVLIVDLGGGTLDVAVVEIADGVLEVRSTTGDPLLGGDDFDERIAAHLAAVFRTRHHIDVSTDPVAMLRLVQAAERARRDLSARESTQVEVPYLLGATPLTATIGLREFQSGTQDLVERCAAPIKAALGDAGVSAPDRVVLVGGATRMPAVAALVAELTGREPSRALHPDEAVAQGAAIQAGILSGTLPDLLLLDVTPLDVGTWHGDEFTSLIPRNTTVPTRRTLVYTTQVDDQADLALTLYDRQGDAHRAMFTAEVGGLPGGPAGGPVVEATLDIDANGLVTVTARDQESGRELPVRVTLPA